MLHAKRATRSGLIDEGGESYAVSVPTGMMNDIVSPHWGSLVEVKGKRKRGGSSKAITLVDIWSLEEEESD